ncbi:Maf family nucleotide pyrophosphatase [Belliella sp. DSM 111904]|uniref:dTTP/UTP pyrophosphatase n=1 Tax=Belliella filtrata TaxID=2923435 RepID=A0ABS9V237_9BACT|nr:Maf family nucleotide pyrophosphatase [Belliella filtrata]MCH7410482.1 Maf family nucleotide pyrophosphatase [Belliella filtrata]
MIDLKNKQLILGSKSPRRKELLDGLGVDFIIKTKDTDESFPEDMDPFEVAGYLSKKKGDAFAQELSQDEVFLTADTVVILNGKILNKPKDKEEAVAMITALSGKTHHVVTGISLTHATGQITLQDKVKVDFADLSAEEISYYVNKFSPLDKAGAYGIQEWIGYVAVGRIEGSFYTVMGLPVHLVYQALKALIEGGK